MEHPAVRPTSTIILPLCTTMSWSDGPWSVLCEQVLEFEGDGQKLTRLSLEHGPSASSGNASSGAARSNSKLSVDGAFVVIGHSPNTEVCHRMTLCLPTCHTPPRGSGWPPCTAAAPDRDKGETNRGFPHPEQSQNLSCKAVLPGCSMVPYGSSL